MKIVESLKTLKNFVRHDGEVGLELETETTDAYSVPKMVYWSNHEDRSLRDFGVEYVLKAPVKVEHELPDALGEFAVKTKDINFKSDPVTASCHIHLNMLNEDWLTFSNFLTLYTMYENLLIRYSGPNRLSNLFCLPISDAEATASNIKTMIKAINQKNYRSLFQMSESHCKYAALNLAAFARLGSLEVRSFRGSTDIKEIKEWVDIIYSLLQFSRQSVNPAQLLEEFKTKGLAFGDEVFGKNWKKLSVDEKLTESLIKKNLWYVQDSIAYVVSDWSTVNEMPKPPKKPDQSLLDKVSLQLFAQPFAALSSSRQEYVYHIATEQANAKKISPYTLVEEVTNATPTAAGNWRDTLRAPLRNTQAQREPHPNDVVLVYRPSADAEIEVFRGNMLPEDDFIDLIRAAPRAA